MQDVETAAIALAQLYVWECITAILEGGSQPDRLGTRERADINKVLKIADAAKQRMLRKYDAARAKEE